MKKFTAVLLALLLILTCIAAVACKGVVLVYLENYDGVRTRTVVYNPNDPLPTPEREGYEFGGWYTDRNLTTPFVDGTQMDASFHLYAKWTAKQQNDPKPNNDIVITFIYNDGVTANRTATTTIGLPFSSVLPTADPSRANYRFDGWWTLASGGEKMLTTTVLTKSMPVYAHWTYIGGGQGDVTPSNVMPKQTYNSATFDKKNLQEKSMQYDQSQGYDPAIGLPSKGTYSALVVPVAFDGESFTSQELADLDKSFNGNSADTGWESVSSYYTKSSYNALNLSFDIQSVYQANHNAAYYESYKKYDANYGDYYNAGDELILQEVLSYYESRLDLTKYDTNGDGCIDAVYLIYSTDVDYDQGDFYWAFTTWYYGEEEYDGLYAYYYFFAGIDFIYESTSKDAGSGAAKIDGLKINASTYIHETGHLLGLDDYYDYEEESGCNEGLGGADMMDFTVGDHNVYSKIMLGWIEPTIVNDTTTITLESLQAMSSNGVKAILIPLNFNNSYFCEYLLIDLYTANGLNALHAGAANSFLYDGALFGVRIYHISSSINNPYDNDYGSFTDYNNSDTNIALIKLVEADGETKFKSSNGYAMDSDLWQTGDKLSKVFPNYARNDGKKLCFDIEIVSASATSATITVTFTE